MPRIEILLVPELSTLTPGVKRAKDWMSLTPRSSIPSCVIAVTLTAILLSDSSRRVAVTTISSSPVAGAAAASGGAAVCATAATGASDHRPASNAASVTLKVTISLEPDGVPTARHDCLPSPRQVDAPATLGSSGLFVPPYRCRRLKAIWPMAAVKRVAPVQHRLAEPVDSFAAIPLPGSACRPIRGP